MKVYVKIGESKFTGLTASLAWDSADLLEAVEKSHYFAANPAQALAGATVLVLATVGADDDGNPQIAAGQQFRELSGAKRIGQFTGQGDAYVWVHIIPIGEEEDFTRAIGQ